MAPVLGVIYGMRILIRKIPNVWEVLNKKEPHCVKKAHAFLILVESRVSHKITS